MFGISQGLKCYESQLPLNFTVTGTPNECQPGSQSCLKSIIAGQVTRNCQAVPCSLTLPGQRNATCATDTNGYTQCCCNTDGCNPASGTLIPFFALGLAGFGFWNI